MQLVGWHSEQYYGSGDRNFNLTKYIANSGNFYIKRFIGDENGTLVNKDFFIIICDKFWDAYKKINFSATAEIVLPCSIVGEHIDLVVVQWLVSYIYRSYFVKSTQGFITVSPLKLLQLANLANFFLLQELEDMALKMFVFRVMNCKPEQWCIATEELAAIVMYIDFFSQNHPEIVEVSFFVFIPILYHWLILSENFDEEDMDAWLRRCEPLRWYKSSLETHNLHKLNSVTCCDLKWMSEESCT